MKRLKLEKDQVAGLINSFWVQGEFIDEEK
jgi:hypothetical protein